MASVQNSWSALWRQWKYNVYWDNTTTIHDFKVQIESQTNVQRSNMKFVGLKINKEYKKKIKRIQDDTLIMYLCCTSKKRHCFKMIGSLQSEMFDIHTISDLRYNRQFVHVIQRIFQRYRILHHKSLPEAITKLIMRYILQYSTSLFQHQISQNIKWIDAKAKESESTESTKAQSRTSIGYSKHVPLCMQVKDTEYTKWNKDNLRNTGQQ
eukprot:569986_1